MGREKIGYSIVLAMGLSIGTLVAENRASAPRPVLESLECSVAPDDAQLELGQVVLHFSENPTIQSLPSTINTNKNDHIFFIPAADFAEQLPAILKAETKKNNKWYTLSVSHETKPIPGIKVVLSYDPEKVSMQHSTFNTLGTKKGISFRLYNQSMISMLKARERSLLRVTQLSPLCVTA